MKAETDDAAVAPARPGRGRPPKGAKLLSIDVITRAALAEIGEKGLPLMSVRSVARRLNVDPKSLYNHVEGKDGLLRAVADFILSTIKLPRATGSLEEDLRAFVHAFRNHALRYPEAASLVMTRPTRSPASLAPIDSVLSLLIAAGFEPARAVHMLRLVMAMLVGIVLREAETGLTFGATNHDAVAEQQRILESSGYPVLVTSARDVALINNDEEFEFALDQIVHLVTDDLRRNAT